MTVRPRIFLALSSFTLFLIACGSGSTAEPTVLEASPARQRGEQIVAAYLEEDSASFRKSRVRFTITAPDEPPKVYELDIWRKHTAGQTSTLSQIVIPAEDAGLGSLTLEAKDKETVNVTYSASRNEFRESDTGKMFFGGLTAQELLGEWGKYDHIFIGEKQLDGAKVYEVEGRLKKTLKSVIARMVVLFRDDNHLPAEMHLFDSLGKEIRTYRNAQFKNDGKKNYVSRLEVDNLVYKTQIIIEVLSREYPAAIDDLMFAREVLKKK